MAVDTINTSLSANDARILNALFDPETLPSSVAKSKDASAIDATLPSHPTISDSQLSELETQQNDIVRRTSKESSLETIGLGIADLDKTITSNPTYPSAFVNRAMLRRLQIEATVPAESHIFSSSEADIELLFTDLARAIQVLEASHGVIQYGEMLTDPDVAKISVVGVGMRSHAGVANTMFRTLSDRSINIQVISTSEIKVSVLIGVEYTELAVRALHSAYGLDVG